jgi:hypothetical protein
LHPIEKLSFYRFSKALIVLAFEMVYKESIELLGKKLFPYCNIIHVEIATVKKIPISSACFKPKLYIE